MEVKFKNKKLIMGLSIIILLFLILLKFKNNILNNKPNIKHNNIAIYIDNIKKNEIPTKDSGYIFDKYLCSDNEAILNWDNNTWSYNINNIKKVVTCNIYFKKNLDTYLVDKVSVGSFIDYLPPTGKSSVSKTCLNPYANQYSGWRVLSKNGSGINGTVTLVHAGTPECYYHQVGQSAQSLINLNNIGKSYVNSALASTGRSMNCNDLKIYNSNACVNTVIINNDIIKTGTIYYLASAFDNNLLWGANLDVDVASHASNTFGVRPVIELKPGIQKIGGQGTNESPFIISN